MRELCLALIAACLMHTTPAPAQQLPYPPGAAPILNSTTGTTGAVTVTLPAAPGRFTYLCGFFGTSAGTTAGLAAAGTITGVVGGPANFTYAYVSSGQGLLGAALTNCLPSSAQNTAIVVTIPGGGAGTVVSLFAWGFQL